MANPIQDAYSPPDTSADIQPLSRWRLLTVVIGAFVCLVYASLLAHMPTAEYSTPDSAVTRNVGLGRAVLAAWFYVLNASALAATGYATISALRGRWIRGLAIVLLTFAGIRMLSHFGTRLMLDAYEWLFPLQAGG